MNNKNNLRTLSIQIWRFKLQGETPCECLTTAKRHAVPVVSLRLRVSSRSRSFSLVSGSGSGGGGDNR